MNGRADLYAFADEMSHFMGLLFLVPGLGTFDVVDTRAVSDNDCAGVVCQSQFESRGRHVKCKKTDSIFGIQRLAFYH